jgi:Asp-tRNA(Asn)/Glu-tRNA(Gln) amidotransferase C subunit
VILAYVGELSSVATEDDIAPRAGDLRNVLRPDETPRAGGEFTQAIIANAPDEEDGYVKVKQIL